MKHADTNSLVEKMIYMFDGNYHMLTYRDSSTPNTLKIFSGCL